MFLDEEPTYGYLPPVYYYQGRVREGLSGLASAKKNYEDFLKLRPAALDDPLAIDARKRVQAIASTTLRR